MVSNTAENLGDAPLTIEISERVPVAQTEEIEVGDLELPRKLKPNAQGVVRWTEVIAPRSKVSWRIGYSIEYPTDFVTRSRAAAAAEEPAASPAPAAAERRKARSMYEQIDALEQAL